MLWDPEPDDEGVISAKTFSIGKLKYNSAIIESVSAFLYRFILVPFSTYSYDSLIINSLYIYFSKITKDFV